MSALALKWAYSQKLGNHIAKSILAFLASHNFGNDQSCFRIKTIAAALDLKETAVKTGLNFLCAKELIKKEERYGKKGERLANEYTLNIPEQYKESFYNDYGTIQQNGGVGRITTGGGSYYDGGVGRITTPLNNKYINNNNEIRTKSFCSSDDERLKDEETSFNYFWEHYPRKQNRKKALEVWRKLKCSTKVDMIVEKVIQQKKLEVQWQDPQMIPLPTSYLNGEKWQDEITQKPNPSIQLKGVKSESRLHKSFNSLQESARRDAIEAGSREKYTETMDNCPFL